VERFFTPDFFRDPYPVYDAIREDVAHWDDELGGWVLTGYAEVAAALADPRVSRGSGPREGDLLTRLLSRMMLFTDPPTTPGSASWRTGRSHPGASSAAAPDRGDRERAPRRGPGRRMDLIGRLACPLPVIVIAEMLSLPAADRVMFQNGGPMMSSL